MKATRMLPGVAAGLAAASAFVSMLEPGAATAALLAGAAAAVSVLCVLLAGRKDAVHAAAGAPFTSLEARALPAPPLQAPILPAVEPGAVLSMTGTDRAEPEKDRREAEVPAKANSALRRLRFADSILAKVPVKTEEAAFALMDRLIAIRDQSAKAAGAVTTAESGKGDAGGVAALAEEARATIARVRSALEEMRLRDRESSKGLQALGKELGSGIELLAGIEEITERSRLIAFNMAIEAARIGEKGRGFKVIVGELRSLNDRTAEFSKRVTGLLGHFKEYNETLQKASVSSTALVAEEVGRGLGEEERAIESLLAASGSCAELARGVAEVVRDVNRELDGVLESLQFQDITRQMVEGALATIAEAEADIAPLGASEGGATSREEERRLVEELRAALIARAKTKGEKEAIREVRT